VKAIDKLALLGARARRRVQAAEAARGKAAEPVPITLGGGTVQVDSARVGARQMNARQMNPNHSDTGRSDPARSDPARSDPARSDPARSGAGRSGAGRRASGHPGVDEPVPVSASDSPEVDVREEAQLWETLREDPNYLAAFPRLAEIVRRRAGEGHNGGDQQRAADDAVWALGEELAHNAKAWYPLIELARLSVHTDRDAALRRLATASDRDPSGRALATGLAMLREASLPSDALGLGVGHWRPREHDLEAGRHLVLASIEAGRIADARRHLDAFSLNPDVHRVAALRAELEGLISRLGAERSAGGPLTDPAGISVTEPLTDLREPHGTGGLRGVFKRH